MLGYDRYLWYFTLYKLRTLKMDKHENDFFHFLTLIKGHSTVLDIGANLGLMSFHMAKNLSFAMHLNLCLIILA